MTNAIAELLADTDLVLEEDGETTWVTRPGNDDERIAFGPVDPTHPDVDPEEAAGQYEATVYRRDEDSYLDCGDPAYVAGLIRRRFGV